MGMKSFMRGKAIVLALALLVFSAGCGGNAKPADNQPAQSAPEGKGSLFAYVGAGLKEPATELAQQYEQKTGVKVEMNFNNSGSLLSQLETMKKGDIYMPGGMPYVEQAKQKGYVDKVVGPVAYHVPVIAVPKGNPKKIEKIQDLAKPGVKLILPEKEATALGKSAFVMFDKLGISKDVEKNVLSYVETAPKIPAVLMMGQGDAGIAEYSNISRNLEKLDLIEIDPAINMVEEIPCATLKSSTQKEEAEKFLEFVRTEGPAAFAKYGFKVKN
jgi:molybdate transport system substrate-binding protein